MFWRPGQVIDDKANSSYDGHDGGHDDDGCDGEEDEDDHNAVPKQYIWGIYRSEQGRQTLFTARHRGAADAVKS